MSETVYHIPALRDDCIKGLDIRPDGIYADATFGGGGHSRAILAKLNKQGHLYGFDQDFDAYANRIEDSRFTFVHSNFRYIKNFLGYYGIEKIDGIMADLGVSFHHFDDAERGFSFRAEAPLDMRMNREAELTAADIVNTYTPEKLTEIFRNYGELRQSPQLVRAIIKARDQQAIATTSDLLHITEPIINPKHQKKELAQIFQALRIEVNGEMQALTKFLESTLSILRTGGRLVIITYHSLEDRLVKNFMRSGNVAGNIEKDFFGRQITPWICITRSPIIPTEAEIEANPRSRSAKLRIAELAPPPEKG